MLSGIAAGVSKTAAAPIERVKLLVQNQDEMIKQGTLDKPYNGVVDCTKRTIASEGVGSFWRGNLANVIRYFPTQALNFAFKGQIKSMFAVSKDASYLTKVSTNIASGGFAGSLSLTVVYSLDFARTRMANDAKGKDGKRQFNGLLDVYKKTIASDGISGLYRGLSSPVSESSSTEVFTSVFTTLSNQLLSAKMVLSQLRSLWDGLSLLSLVLHLTQLIQSEDE